MISHKEAASFLAETEISFSLSLQGNPEAVEYKRCCVVFSIEGEDVVLVFHSGTGVVDPPFFPAKIALLNLYLLAKEDEDEDEQFLFLILLCEISLRPSLRLLFV